ncbi:MAG: helicase [Fusobacterium necrophorum]|nr:helicase [Fusobacterium necrophorum]
MKGMERGIVLFKKVNPNEPMEEMHKRVMKGLSKIEAPLGLKDSDIPETPDFGTRLSAVYFTKNIKTKGVEIRGRYSWRETNNWDDLVYEFRSSYKLIDYKRVISVDLPKVIKIYEPYEVQGYFLNVGYVGAYEEGTTPETRTYKESINPACNKLKSMGIIPDELGKNLFTLQPVMYFSGEMCKEVIRLSRDEIIKRLEGKAQKVFSLLDGVYIIFNDKVEMSYEEFKEMNDIYKPILGLI